MSASPARQAAFKVVRRVFEDGAYADRALNAEALSLDARERALATALAYGTVQRARTLDHLLTPLVSRPLEKLDSAVLQALRLGVFQLALLDGIAPHAAVNESVELIKPTHRSAVPMVNAVLRRAVTEAPRRLAELRDDTPEHAAVLHSLPDWIAELWWRELGPEEARALMAVVNAPAESALRINTLQAPLHLELPVANQPAPELPEGRVLSEPFDAFGSRLWVEGKLMPQSRASMLVARALDPQPGERVLDLCAAPGGKTTHLAALMGGEGELVAVEVNEARARGLTDTAARMGAVNVRVAVADGRELTETGFDRVLVDPPCSGLGTLQSRPDLRWQAHRGDLAALQGKQLQLLEAGARALAPGGTLVYSVCTVTEAESTGTLDAFSAAHPEFALQSSRRLLPHRDGTDGFFIARLGRA